MALYDVPVTRTAAPKQVSFRVRARSPKEARLKALAMAKEDLVKFGYIDTTFAAGGADKVQPMREAVNHPTNPCKEIAERQEKKRETYDDGRVACKAGISRAANPWPVHDPKYQQWAMGWLDEDRKRSKR